MVDFNLIHSLGNMDEEVNSAVTTALGDAADDMQKLIVGDDVQDFTPGAIITGRIIASRARARTATASSGNRMTHKAG